RSVAVSGENRSWSYRSPPQRSPSALVLFTSSTTLRRVCCSEYLSFRPTSGLKPFPLKDVSKCRSEVTISFMGPRIQPNPSLEPRRLWCHYRRIVVLAGLNGTCEPLLHIPKKVLDRAGNFPSGKMPGTGCVRKIGLSNYSDLLSAGDIHSCFRCRRDASFRLP